MAADPPPDATYRSPPARFPARGRQVVWLLVRLAVTSGALAWTFSQIELGDLLAAANRISFWAAITAFVLGTSNAWVGAGRWHILLAAYGATRSPSVTRLTHIYLVGLFYNTFLPANVGGDVVRGFVTRKTFPGSPGSFMIVGIERVFGLAGLLLLAASVLLLHPIDALGASMLPIVALAGIATALAATLAPVIARRLSWMIPARWRTQIEQLPIVERPGLLVAVLAFSVLTQAIVATSAYALLRSIDATVSLSEALVLIPVALVAMYFPTVAGLGTREAAFVVLLGTVGVREADATAASLAFFAVQLAVACLGGAVHLLAPLRTEEAG